MAAKPDSRIDTVVSLAKRRGLVFPCGEIYGGTKSAWDYGPLGVELKENVKRQWWRSMVTSRDDVVGLDSSVILAREVWEASGHLKEFSDPLYGQTYLPRKFKVSFVVPPVNDMDVYTNDLGFIGVGLPPPTPEWGSLLSVARSNIPDFWWTALFPGIFIFLTVFGFNLLGDGLRDVLDPKSRR